MKIAGQEGRLGRLFEWFLRGENTTLFLRLSVLFNFAFAAIPIGSMAWFRVSIENEPLLVTIRTEHPEIILISIRHDYVFLGSVFICALMVSAEILYCLKTNWSTFTVCFQTISQIIPFRLLKTQETW
jgi:hypothetical protein